MAYAVILSGTSSVWIPTSEVHAAGKRQIFPDLLTTSWGCRHKKWWVVPEGQEAVLFPLALHHVVQAGLNVGEGVDAHVINLSFLPVVHALLIVQLALCKTDEESSN